MKLSMGRISAWNFLRRWNICGGREPAVLEPIGKELKLKRGGAILFDENNPIDVEVKKKPRQKVPIRASSSKIVENITNQFVAEQLGEPVAHSGEQSIKSCECSWTFGDIDRIMTDLTMGGSQQHSRGERVLVLKDVFSRLHKQRDSLGSPG